MAKRTSIRKYRVQKKRGKLLKSLSRQARRKLTKKRRKHSKHKKHKKHKKTHRKSIRGGMWNLTRTAKDVVMEKKRKKDEASREEEEQEVRSSGPGKGVLEAGQRAAANKTLYQLNPITSPGPKRG